MIEFYVSRTSCASDVKPCDDAYEKEFTTTRVYGNKTIQTTEKLWAISFQSMEEFLLFVKKHKQLIVTADNKIEIYDDYRE